MSLYLQYRPQAFADVSGQDHIVTTLENAAKQDKLAHAYLFAGTRGTGKTTTARILAKTIMTRGIEDEVLKKQIIKGVEEGSLVDLIEIDGASNRGIDDVRDLIEKIQFSPVVAAAKVYIIDEVHMLTKEAFNALLKTLEEPPSYAYFILATTEAHKVPTTIQSRCQSFPFRRIREEDIIRRLQYIADQEKISIDREAVRAIARHSEGGMRDAISLLDQLRSLDAIALEDVEQRVGRSGIEHVQNVIEALQNCDGAEVLTAVRAMEDAGVAMDVFLRQLLSLLRTQLHEAIDASQSTDSLLRMIDAVLSALRDVRNAPVPGLVVEAALLSLCSTSDTSSVVSPASIPAAPPSKREKKEEKKSAPVSVAKEDELADTPQDATVDAPELSLDSLRQQWAAMVKKVEPAAVRMSLKNGQLHALEGSKLIIQFTSGFHRDKVAATDASRAVEKVLHDTFKTSLTIECTVDIDASSVPDEAKQEVVNLADAASEIF